MELKTIPDSTTEPPSSPRSKQEKISELQQESLPCFHSALLFTLSVSLCYFLTQIISKIQIPLSFTSIPPSTLAHNTDLLKSLTDNRIYEIIQLQNNLQCILISDESALKSSASLNINVEGYYSNIASFAQNIIIKNTPQGQEFRSVIAKYNGNLKLNTKNGINSYYFDIDNEGFVKAIKTFYEVVFNSPLKIPMKSETPWVYSVGFLLQMCLIGI